MALTYLHYDVFTDQALRGNQLAVFTDARGLEDWRMQALAREMNFAESTFILPSERAGTGVRMRIFTPFVEMPMAGHPTIGSTFALAETGVIRSGSSRFVFGLNVGPVPVDLEWESGRLRFAWMTQANPEFGHDIAQRASVAQALALVESDLDPDLPVQQVSCGNRFIMVPVADRETVDRAIADAAAFRRLGSIISGEIAVYLFAVTRQADETVYARMFAFDFGVAEDPATGSAAGPLGCYLVRHGVVAGDEARNITVTQGVLMGRESHIYVAIGGDRHAITDVKVGGRAVLVGRGELLA